MRPADAQVAIDIARSVVGGELVRVESLSGGEQNAVIRVTTSTRDVVVRWLRAARPTWHPDLGGEFAAMQLAASVGVRVPPVLHYDDTTLVYEHIAGRPMRVADAPGEGSTAAGRQYGLLHRIERAGFGPVQPDGADPGWAWEVFCRDVMSEAENLVALSGEVKGELNVDEVCAAAELVIAASPDLRPRLVHGDASPSNTLVGEDGSIAALIDFEGAWFADPAVDLAWWWWNTPEGADDFQRGCEEVSEPFDPPVIWLHRVRLLVGLAEAFATKRADRAHRIAALLPLAVSELRGYV